MFKKFFVLLFIFLSFTGSAVAKENKKYSVHISWQTNTIVSNDYKAKAPSSPKSKIDIIAAVFDRNGKLVNSNKLKFLWQVNKKSNFFNNLSGKIFKSGYGKNRITISDMRVNKTVPLLVEVFVKDSYNNIGLDKVYIPIKELLVQIKEGDSCISKQKIFSREDIVLYPKVYFIPESLFNRIRYRWLIDGRLFAGLKKLNLNFTSNKKKNIKLIVIDKKNKLKIGESKFVEIYFLAKEYYGK